MGSTYLSAPVSIATSMIVFLSGHVLDYVKDFSILIDERKFGISRDILYKALMAENIIVKKYFSPSVHKIKAFMAYSKNLYLPVTEKVSENSLSLPLSSHIKDAVIKKICRTVEKIYIYRELIGQ